MEDIITEKFDDVPITCLRPTWVTVESMGKISEDMRLAVQLGEYVNLLGTLVDEAKLAQKSHKTSVFEFTC